MSNGEPVRTIDLSSLSGEHFKIEGEDYITRYVFGGRYIEDRLEDFDPKNTGTPTSMHTVTVKLVMDTRQFIQFQQSMLGQQVIPIKLVSHEPTE